MAKQTIYKYTVPVQDVFKLDLPKGARVLSVQMQGTQAQMWVLLDPTNENELRTFEVFGTGNPIPDISVHGTRDFIRVFISTFQAGPFVWHVFEVSTYQQQKLLNQ